MHLSKYLLKCSTLVSSNTDSAVRIWDLNLDLYLDILSQSRKNNHPKIQVILLPIKQPYTLWECFKAVIKRFINLGLLECSMFWDNLMFGTALA